MSDTPSDANSIFQIEGNSLAELTIAIAKYGNRTNDQGAAVFFREIYPIRETAQMTSPTEHMESHYSRENKVPLPLPMDMGSNLGRC